MYSCLFLFTDLFEDLCNWMAGNTSLCKTKDYISLVLALASINYIPEKFSFIYKVIEIYMHEFLLLYHHLINIVILHYFSI